MKLFSGYFKECLESMLKDTEDQLHYEETWNGNLSDKKISILSLYVDALNDLIGSLVSFESFIKCLYGRIIKNECTMIPYYFKFDMENLLYTVGIDKKIISDITNRVININNTNIRWSYLKELEISFDNPVSFQYVSYNLITICSIVNGYMGDAISKRFGSI